MALVVAG